MEKLIHKPDSKYRAQNDYDKRLPQQPKKVAFHPTPVKSQFIPNKSQPSPPPFQVHHHQTIAAPLGTTNGGLSRFDTRNSYGEKSVSGYFSKANVKMEYDIHRPESYYEWGGKKTNDGLMVDNWTMEETQKHILSDFDSRDFRKVLTTQDNNVLAARSKLPGLEDFMKKFDEKTETEYTTRITSPEDSLKGKKEMKEMKTKKSKIGALIKERKVKPPTVESIEAKIAEGARETKAHLEAVEEANKTKKQKSAAKTISKSARRLLDSIKKQKAEEESGDIENDEDSKQLQQVAKKLSYSTSPAGKDSGAAAMMPVYTEAEFEKKYDTYRKVADKNKLKPPMSINEYKQKYIAKGYIIKGGDDDKKGEFKYGDVYPDTGGVVKETKNPSPTTDKKKTIS